MEDLPKFRILVIDDISEIRNLYRLILERSGYEVSESDCGASALRKDWTMFDVVITDILMPGMSGDDMIRQAFAKWGKDLPPIIVVTSLDAKMIEVLNARLPVNARIITKSGSREAVSKTIREAVVDATSNHSPVQ
jgi:CheY-like chemotaxis protein